MKNKFAIVLSVIIVILIFSFQPLYAANDVGYIKPSISNTGTGNITAATNIANLIWSTAVIILQVAAIAAVAIAGIRYMLSSADTKADIKKQTFNLIIGAVLTFCSSTVIAFLVKVIQSAF